MSEKYTFLSFNYKRSLDDCRGCILYISSFWQDESHLPRRCGHANLTFVCAQLPSTVSVGAAALGREKHTQQAAANANRGLRETAAPRNDWVELSYSKGDPFPNLGLFGDAGAHYPPAAMGSLEELCEKV